MHRPRNMAKALVVYRFLAPKSSCVTTELVVMIGS